MENILDFAKDVVNSSLSVSKDITEILVDYAQDMAGTKPHNIIHCGSKDSVIRNPSLPLCATFPAKSCEVGTLIGICATPSSPFLKRFRIDFLTECDHFSGPSSGDQTKSIVFHFNPRFNEGNCVVMNALVNGEWGAEERPTYFPFKQGVPFKMMILIEEDRFKVAIDGKHCYDFKHRTDFRHIKRIHVDGNLAVDLIEFRKELKHLSSLSDVAKELSASSCKTVCEELKSMHDEPTDPKTVIVPCPTLPYSDQDGRFGRPFNLYIAGLMPNYFRRFFVVNFASSKYPDLSSRTTHFHLSIRPDQGAMVRNTMTSGVYGHEETDFDGQFPFVLGTHFDLMLCNRHDQVSVIVNGQLVCVYKHRLDAKSIDLVEINGSPLITSLRFEFF